MIKKKALKECLIFSMFQLHSAIHVHPEQLIVVERWEILKRYVMIAILFFHSTKKWHKL